MPCHCQNPQVTPYLILIPFVLVRFGFVLFCGSGFCFVGTDHENTRTTSKSHKQLKTFILLSVPRDLCKLFERSLTCPFADANGLLSAPQSQFELLGGTR